MASTGTGSLALIEGPNLALRLVRPDDAEYIFDLRTDLSYKRHLSEVRGTAKDQRLWIEGYKAREARGEELYYVIERRNGTPCGTVRLYDIGDESFTWGSWILDRNKPRKAALESAVLSFGVGFDGLGLERALISVNNGNDKAGAFYRRFGMAETHRSEEETFFVYQRSRFEADRAAHLTILESEARA